MSEMPDHDPQTGEENPLVECQHEQGAAIYADAGVVVAPCRKCGEQFEWRPKDPEHWTTRREDRLLRAIAAMLARAVYQMQDAAGMTIKTGPLEDEQDYLSAGLRALREK